jgi:hypothetical protein
VDVEAGHTANGLLDLAAVVDAGEVALVHGVRYRVAVHARSELILGEPARGGLHRHHDRRGTLAGGGVGLGEIDEVVVHAGVGVDVSCGEAWVDGVEPLVEVEPSLKVGGDRDVLAFGGPER